MNQYECFDIWLSQQNRPKGRGLCIKMKNTEKFSETWSEKRRYTCSDEYLQVLIEINRDSIPE